MDGLADVDWIAAHLDREADLADQVSGMSPDNAAAKHAVVGFIKQNWRWHGRKRPREKRTYRT